MGFFDSIQPKGNSNPTTPPSTGGFFGDITNNKLNDTQTKTLKNEGYSVIESRNPNNKPDTKPGFFGSIFKDSSNLLSNEVRDNINIKVPFTADKYVSVKNPFIGVTGNKKSPVVEMVANLPSDILQLPTRALITGKKEIGNLFSNAGKAKTENLSPMEASLYGNKEYKTTEQDIQDRIDAGEGVIQAHIGAVSSKTLDVAVGAQIAAQAFRKVSSILAKNTDESLIESYKTLGYPKTEAELKANIRSYSKQFHPDVAGGSDEAIKVINKAKDIIEKNGGLPTTLQKFNSIASKQLERAGRETAIGKGFFSDIVKPNTDIKAPTQPADLNAPRLPGSKVVEGQPLPLGMSTQKVERVGGESAVPAVDKNLVEEAKKYKSAEDFANKDKSIYSDTKIEEAIKNTDASFQKENTLNESFRARKDWNTRALRGEKEIDIYTKIQQSYGTAIAEYVSDSVKNQKSELVDIYNQGKSGTDINVGTTEVFAGAGKNQIPTYEGTKDLTVTTLDKLKGRSTVSKQFISDLTNAPELKQAERDIIREKLAEYPDGKDVPVKEFADKVHTELLPLKVKNEPIKPTKAKSELRKLGIRFEQDMSGEANIVNKDGEYLEYDSLPESTQRLVDTALGNAESYSGIRGAKYENISLPSELRGNVKNYKENIYESPVKTSAGDVHFSGQTKNYFGHTRIEDMADGKTRRVIEAQSDLYQKGRLEGSVLEGAGEKVAKQSRDGKLEDVIMPSDLKPYKSSIERLQQYNNPTAHFRMVREEIKKAAEDGIKKLQFPTGETAMKIEGLGQESNWFDNDKYESILKNGLPEGMGGMQAMRTQAKLDIQNLSIGKAIKQGIEGFDWIITDVLGDGKFKAIPKHMLDATKSNEDLFWNGKKIEGRTLEDVKPIIDHNTETFDISGKVDTSNPIYKFYEKELGRYLKNKYGAELVTDAQGVKWYEVNVSKDMANAPVTAFKRYAGEVKFDLTEKEATKIFYKIFKPSEVTLVLSKDLGDNLGQFIRRKDPFSGEFKDMVSLLVNDGKVSSDTLFHEAFHKFFRSYISPTERIAMIKNVKRNLLAASQKLYRKDIYDTPDKRAEEWLADDFANYVRSVTGEERYTGFFMRTWEKFLNFLRRLIRKSVKAKNVYKSILEGKRPEYNFFTKEEMNARKFNDEIGPYDKEAQAKEKGLMREVLADVEPKSPQSPLTQKGNTETAAKRLSSLPDSKEVLDTYSKSVAQNKERVMGTVKIGDKEIDITKGGKMDIPVKKPMTDPFSKDEGPKLLVQKPKVNTDPEKAITYTTETINASHSETNAGLDELNRLEVKARASVKSSDIIEAEKVMKGLDDQYESLKDIVDNSPFADKKNRLLYNKDGDIVEIGDSTSAKRTTFIEDRMKATGIEDPQLFTQAVEKYREQKKSLYELDLKRKDLKVKIRAIKDKEANEKALGKFLEKEHVRTAGNVLNQEKVKQLQKATEAAARKLADEAETKRLFAERIKKAQIEKRDKPGGLFKKGKEALYPILSLDAETQSIYKRWKREKLVATEMGNSELEKFKSYASGDIDEIIAYQAGANIPYIKNNFDSLFTEAKRAGLDFSYRERYLPQVYSNSPEEVASAIAKWMEDSGVEKQVVEDYVKNNVELPEEISTRLGLRPSFVKERVFPNYMTAMEYGLKPKYTKAIQLMAYYREAMQKAIANKRFLDTLLTKGLVLPVELAPDHWKALGLPFSSKGYYAEPKLAKVLNGEFRDEADLGLGEYLLKRTAQLSKFLQETALSAGLPFTNLNFFAIGQVFKELTRGNLKVLPIAFKSENNVIKWFTDNSQYTKMMASEGIDVGSRVGSYGNIYNNLSKKWAVQASTIFKKPLNKSSYNGMGMMLGESFSKAFNAQTFGSFMPQLYTQTFKDAYLGATKKGLGVSEAKKFAADVTRNIFGLIEETGRTKLANDSLSSLFFAPRFREGIINVMLNTLKSGGDIINSAGGLRKELNPKFKLNRKLLAGMILTYGLYNLANKKLTGDYMWDNPPGHEFDLRFNLSNGEIAYVPFMPSFLSFGRNLASGFINIGTGNFDVAGQKFGSLFSMPIKISSEVLTNSDYFGRPIYKKYDDLKTKITKIAGYIGLQSGHTYIKELLKRQQWIENTFFRNSLGIPDVPPPLWQSLSIAFELPIKFSSMDKAESSSYYEAMNEHSKERSQEKDRFMPTYQKIRDLKEKELAEKGTKIEADKLFNALSPEEKVIYRNLQTAEKAQKTKKAKVGMYSLVESNQKLKREGKKDEADKIYNALSDEEKRVYQLAKKALGYN